MSFTNSSHIDITGENTFNHVQGNQFNNTINAGIVHFNTGQAVVKRTKYDQFRQVIRGDMITLKELSSEEITDWERRWTYGKVVREHKARRTTCTVEVYPDRKSKFTTVMYEGEGAEWFWEKEFEIFSRTRKPLIAQLFGINRSEIPMLIFHDELIPCAQFFNGESIWMDVYIQHLMRNMGCSRRNLWMNTAGGVLFRGPDGPSVPIFHSSVVESLAVPTTVDMLKDDTCLRFLTNFGPNVDESVLWCANYSTRPIYLNSLVPATAEDQSKDYSSHPSWSLAIQHNLRDLWRKPPDHFPISVVSGLRFDTVYSPSMEAVASWPRGAGSLWEWFGYINGLEEETVLDDGLRRFELVLTPREDVSLKAKYDWQRFRRGWLSQSSRVFDAVEVAEEEDFFIVDPPWLEIQSSRRPIASRTLRNDEHPIKEIPPTPIYLFLHPLPMSVSEFVSWMDGHFYFWSLDKTGQSRVSEEECERWGLPVLKVSTFLSNASVRLFSSPAHVCTGLRDWQKARGFDPATSDWARHMDYPELEIVGTRKVQGSGERKAGSSWWPWPWEAVAGTEISAFGF